MAGPRDPDLWLRDLKKAQVSRYSLSHHGRLGGGLELLVENLLKAIIHE